MHAIEKILARNSGRETVRRLREAGLQMAVADTADTRLSDRLSGKTVVVSGNFSLSREAMKALVEAHGGKGGNGGNGGNGGGNADPNFKPDDAFMNFDASDKTELPF